jgi:hypothetical protein
MVSMCWKARKLAKKGTCFSKFAETPRNYSTNGTVIASYDAQMAEIRHDSLTATTNWPPKKGGKLSP